MHMCWSFSARITALDPAIPDFCSAAAEVCVPFSRNCNYFPDPLVAFRVCFPRAFAGFTTAGASA
jgi:hypothetical protein